MNFSLSLEAQNNWMGLVLFQSMLSWPIGLTTNDDQEYSLELANLNAFVGTGVNTVKSHIASGRALKLAVNAATDKAGVDAVEDNR